MKTRIIVTVVLLLSAFTMMLLFATQTSAHGQMEPLRIEYQQITPTITITPTQIFTVTVIVTATPEPATPTPTATPIPLPPDAPAILADIEAEFYALWAQMAPLQLAYYFQYGRPWQGLMTHTTIPQDGTPTPPDRLLLHPTDIQENWMDFMPSVNQSLRYAVRVDTYEGQGGRGFVGQLYVVVDGDTWHRAIDYGSGEFDQEWSIELLP